METTQILLTIIVTTLTIILTITGIQFFFILKELRKSLQKINKILDDGMFFSTALTKSVNGIGGFLSGIKAGLSFLNLFKKRRKEEYGNKE